MIITRKVGIFSSGHKYTRLPIASSTAVDLLRERAIRVVAKTPLRNSSLPGYYPMSLVNHGRHREPDVKKKKVLLRVSDGLRRFITGCRSFVRWWMSMSITAPLVGKPPTKKAMTKGHYWNET